MLKKVQDVQPPTGFKLFMLRTPLFLYRVGFGWLLGQRFLLLNHVGRKSGLPRQTVLEVVQYDKATDTYTIAAGFGKQSHWYQNLRQQPETTIQVGRRQCRVQAHFLTSEEGAQKMMDYAQRNAKVAKTLVRVMGYEVDGSMEDYAEFGKVIPFITLQVFG